PLVRTSPDMGLLDKFKSGLQKTHQKLVHEMKRIVTRSPRLTGSSMEELQAVLIAADFGVAMTDEILGAVRRAYETQGGAGQDVFEVAAQQVEGALTAVSGALKKQPTGLTVVSIVGVNGTGKTTTGAKLAHWVQSQGEVAFLAACDTFRAAAIEQIKLW